MIRLFVEAPLSAGGTVTPTQDQARYLTTVMRLSAGDELLLFNGRDGEWRARVDSVGKRGCTLAVEARTRLAEDGVGVRVVSMPCREWYDAQPQAYRDEVIPPIVKARVSVEAGVAQGWREIVGDHGRIVSIDTFGASADAARMFTEYGFTAEAVANAVRDSLRSTAH